MAKQRAKKKNLEISDASYRMQRFIMSRYAISQVDLIEAMTWAQLGCATLDLNPPCNARFGGFQFVRLPEGGTRIWQYEADTLEELPQSLRLRIQESKAA